MEGTLAIWAILQIGFLVWVARAKPRAILSKYPLAMGLQLFLPSATWRDRVAPDDLPILARWRSGVLRHFALCSVLPMVVLLALTLSWSASMNSRIEEMQRTIRSLRERPRAECPTIGGVQ